MKIACISDTTYRSSTPDYVHNKSYYGSEPYHCVLAKELSKRGHDVHWFAPHGSEPVGTFHPIVLSFGTFRDYDTLENLCLDPFKTEDCLQFDFIIDMSASARTLEELFWYHGYKNFCSYRNGYNSFHSPRLRPEQKHSVVPSKQNQEMFAKAGVPSRVAYYGIDDKFYCPGDSPEYWKWPDLEKKNYWLFPHRPTPDKGISLLMQLVKDFPKEQFVIAGSTPVTEHQAYLNELKQAAHAGSLTNIKFISLPLNPKHHYYKRELMRNAKGVLCPIGDGYFEGFGLSAAECVAAGSPCIWSSSPSAWELWRNEVDGLIVEGVTGFSMAIKHFNSYNFAPTNRYTVTKYAERYEAIAAEIMLG